MKFALTGDLTINTAADAKVRLLDGLAAGEALEVDTQQVSEVDLAGLQVLLAAFKNAAESGILVCFPKPSRGPAVSVALRLLGLSEMDWNQKDAPHGQENTGR